MPSWRQLPNETRAPVEIDFDRDNYLKELGLPSDEELSQLIKEAEEQQAIAETQQEGSKSKSQEDVSPQKSAKQVQANAAPSFIQMRFISKASSCMFYPTVLLVLELTLILY